jgi:CRISPR/Cas system CMR-associated protein Cmr1 (group 7 of RAMP superfamily)
LLPSAKPCVSVFEGVGARPERGSLSLECAASSA